MKQALVVLFLCFSSFSAFSQKIDYSLVDRDDFKEMNFEIIGRMGNNINIYKNNRNRHDISVYDNDMQIKNRIKLDFMPEKVYTVDFVSYGDFAYMIYQHQRRNIVTYSMVKINQDGKLMTDPVDLDTSQIGGNSDNKVYSMITSDDKKKIVIFKIKRINDKNFQITSLLYNNQMELVKKTSFDLNNQDREGLFTEFLVDNDGDFVFGRACVFAVFSFTLKRNYMVAVCCV